MYHVVEFHADGGQMCVPGHRSFTNPEKAKQFADQMRSEPEHTCGSKSVLENTLRKPISATKAPFIPKLPTLAVTN